MEITMQFPPGVFHFIDSTGYRALPDANGQVTIPIDKYGEYLAAGFMPAGLIGAEITQEADLSDLEAADVLKAKAMSGDMQLVISPATLSTPATSAAWQRTVTISLKSAAGDVHSWFNAAIASGVSIADDSVAGTASIPSTTLSFVNGVATVVISGDEADWLQDETDTLTVADMTVLGQTVDGGTSVETFSGGS